MRKLAAVLALATPLVVVSCADLAQAPPLEPMSIAQDHVPGGGEHNGPTWVIVTFDLTLAVIPPGVNQHPEGKGSCRDANGVIHGPPDTHLNTVWYNEQGKKTASKFCAGSSNGGGGTVACQATSGELPATYAAAGNDPGQGNENLNFFWNDPDADPDDQFVHYHSNSDETNGVGAVDFAFTCAGGQTGGASLALDQFEQEGGNRFQDGAAVDQRALDPAGATVATTLGSGDVTSIYWVYRSRVGS